jgi:hypothetical protein
MCPAGEYIFICSLPWAVMTIVIFPKPCSLPEQVLPPYWFLQPLLVSRVFLGRMRRLLLTHVSCVPSGSTAPTALLSWAAPLEPTGRPGACRVRPAPESVTSVRTKSLLLIFVGCRSASFSCVIRLILPGTECNRLHPLPARLHCDGNSAESCSRLIISISIIQLDLLW